MRHLDFRCKVDLVYSQNLTAESSSQVVTGISRPIARQISFNLWLNVKRQINEVARRESRYWTYRSTSVKK